MMPRLNGFDVCSRLRFDGYQTPVLFLTAKGDIVDKSIGFKSGGDDYLVKPFIAEELSLRINALLKRKGNLAGEVHIPEQMIYKGLEIYPTRFKAFVDGRQIDLTPKEFRILALLASRPGEVFTREQLIENVWGEEFVGESSGITGFIRKIREKIETDPSRPFYVQTVWKIGYRLGD
jgi:two-component system response regulator VicR